MTTFSVVVLIGHSVYRSGRKQKKGFIHLWLRRITKTSFKGMIIWEWEGKRVGENSGFCGREWRVGW